MATVITKEGDSIVTTVDGVVTNVQSIRREDNVISVPPTDGSQVDVVYVNTNKQLVVDYNGNTLTLEDTAASLIWAIVFGG